MEPNWKGPQTHLGCGCKLYMVREDDGFEAPEIAFCPTHAGAPNLVAKLEAAERLALMLRRARGHLDCWHLTGCRECHRCPACLVEEDATRALQAWDAAQ